MMTVTAQTVQMRMDVGHHLPVMESARGRSSAVGARSFVSPQTGSVTVDRTAQTSLMNTRTALKVAVKNLLPTSVSAKRVRCVK